MTPEEREELRSLVREEPTIAATFAAIDAEVSAAVAHAESLGKRRAELLAKLSQIGAAKRKLASVASSPAVAVPEIDPIQTPQTGEPAPSFAPAAKPTSSKGTKS